MKNQRGRRGIATLILNLGATWTKWSTSRPGCFTPRKETQHQLYSRLGGSQYRSGRVRKISPPTGIRSSERTARSESLHRLSCRDTFWSKKSAVYCIIRQKKKTTGRKVHSFCNDNLLKRPALHGVNTDWALEFCVLRKFVLGYESYHRRTGPAAD